MRNRSRTWLVTGIAALALVLFVLGMTAYRLWRAYANDRYVYVYQASSGKRVCALRNKGHVLSADFSPDGRRIVLSDARGNITLWSIPSSKKTGMLTFGQGIQYVPTYSPDGKHIAITIAATSAVRHNLVIWKIAGDHVVGSPVKVFGPARFSPDGALVCGISESNKVAVVRTQDGALMKMLEGNDDAAFSPDGRMLATARRDGGSQVFLWRVSDWSLIRRINTSGYGKCGITFTPDSRTLISANQTVQGWSTEDGKALFTLQGGSPAALSPSGEMLACAANGQQGIAAIWNLRNHKSAPTFTAGAATPGFIERMAFPANGSLITSTKEGRNRGAVTGWSIPAGHKSFDLPMSRLLAISPNGSLIAVASSDVGD